MVSAGKRPPSQVEHLLPGTGRGFQGLGSWASISLRSALWGLSSYFGQRSEQGWFFQKVFSIAFDKVLQDKKPLVWKEFEELNFLSASSLKEIKTFKSTFKLPLEPLKTLYFKNRGTSLVAQWLRICLPMQGTRVRALVREDPTCRATAKPMCHNYWACALEPACHNYWSPCA